MGLLVGLPLGIFRLLAGFLLLALRLAVPILVILALVLLFRRMGRQGGRQEPPPRQQPREPHFDGPVYTVDYEDVDDESER